MPDLLDFVLGVVDLMFGAASSIAERVGHWHQRRRRERKYANALNPGPSVQAIVRPARRRRSRLGPGARPQHEQYRGDPQVADVRDLVP